MVGELFKLNNQYNQDKTKKTVSGKQAERKEDTKKPKDKN
jgi:hypothetical protein